MASKVEKQEYAQYLSEARSWETNKVMALEKSRKTAWIIAISAGALSFISVIALMLLTPLKTVQPYVIRVDNTTGAVDVVTALKNGKTNYDETMNKYFTQLYVRWREGYSMALAQEYYTNVGMLSSRVEQAKYLQYFSPKNPNSPLNVYKNVGIVTIKIKSTSFISPNIALVRYVKEVASGTGDPVVTHWAATINFQYVGTPMSEHDRAINPLGFQVLEYRNDPDQQVSDSAAAPSAQQSPVQAPVTNKITVFPGDTSRVPAIEPNR